MLVIQIITFIILLISLTRDVTHSEYGRDSVISDDDSRMLREILQRLNTMQNHINRIERNVNQMKTNNNIRFDKLEANTNDLKMQNLSVAMEAMKNNFCCCQYQNTTDPPVITPKPVKSLPTNCAEAMREGDGDGVYQINVTDSTIGPFDVYCMKKVKTKFLENVLTGIWLIFQRRQDNTTDFYQNWNMYQRGFGDLKGNFWIGLDKLYVITKASEQELWIQLEDHKGHARWEKYSHFAIGNEYEKYALKTVGRHVGNATDSLTYHEGQKWSTFDQENGVYHCAQLCKGAWWYKDCHHSNLNGMYGNNNEGQGINWGHWRGWKYSLKYAHMAIRPRQ